MATLSQRAPWQEGGKYDATPFSIMTLSIMTHGIKVLLATEAEQHYVSNAIMLSVSIYWYAECRYGVCRYAECHGVINMADT